MKIRNFTPHTVMYEHKNGTREEFVSEGSIRINTKMKPVKKIEGMRFVSFSQQHEKTILPTQEDGVFFIVSGMVRNAFPQRTDFISPCTDPRFVIRDESGRVEAVKAWQIQME